MKSEFVGEPVEVELEADKPGRPPAAVCWRDETWPARRVEAVWHDTSWGPMRPGKARWWQRRHRTYYQLTVADGRIFEIYHDRGVKQWVLYRILHPEPHDD